ncbi:J domain-containing protein [Luteimonas sp. MC1895]|uniref:DnaJ domain-containing protein n=1 Tax=Luteimonas sp. MC1895 TaxID=2819513 RepID=UPI0018F0FF46|nr:J domain-containing protein [Luteimonas sp. MC1895]
MGEHAGMVGQGGEALDQALGLLRAPALRTALRTRPLPQGIGELLAIASGTSDATRGAISRTGRAEAELVEAARFYVQQVLLAEGADAYRQLGAAPDADQAVLREHHHLLMRWLHPDRSEGAQWDSALSTRVNQAWNHLRTPAARARYDAEHLALATPVGAATAAIPIPITYTPLQPPKPIPTGPIAVAFLTIACLALAWLAVTREDRLDDLRDASRFQETGVDVSQRMAAPLPQVMEEVAVRVPAMVVSVPEGQPEVLTETATQTVPEPATEMETAAAQTETAAAHSAGYPVLEAATFATEDVSEGDWGREIAAVAAPTGGRDTADPLQLFRQAEAAVDSVSAWFSSGRGGEPLWLDLPVSLEAAALRQDLRARHDARQRGRMSVNHPNWTLGTESASMSGAYRFGGRRGTVETGVLHVGLERRGAHWRIARLHLDPAR